MKQQPFYTHGGFFHADELAGFNTLRLAGVCDRAIRLTDLTNIPDDGIVGDIGREYIPEKFRFDHHQGMFRRANGVPLATAGMVWQHFGAVASMMATTPEKEQPINKAQVSEKHKAIARRVDETLIQGIDAHDADNAYIASATCSTGDKTFGEVRINTISNIIAGFNTGDVSNAEAQDAAFNEASALMERVLRSHIAAAAKFIEAKGRFESVATFHQDGKVIELSEGLPWREIVHEAYPDTRYVIMPSNHPGNKFSMTAVTVKPESRECIIPIERPDWFTNFIHEGKWIAGANVVSDLLDLAGWNIEWSGK